MKKYLDRIDYLDVLNLPISSLAVPKLSANNGKQFAG